MKDSKKTLVVIAAHADDAEINAGGTMAKWAAETGPVHIIMMTNNCSGAPWEGSDTVPGPDETWPEAARRVRHTEQDAAAAKIGAKVHYMDFAQRHFETPEGRVNLSWNPADSYPRGVAGQMPILIACQDTLACERVADIVVGLNPSLILTQNPCDRDPEHHSVASLVWRVVFQNRDQLGEVPVRFWECGSSCENGMLPVPYDHIENISDYYDTKLELCACHESQMIESRWTRVKERASRWGKKIGVRYAEAFCTAQFPD